jgi:hypothetical protein
MQIPCREENQRLQGELERAQHGSEELSASVQQLEAAAAAARQQLSTRDGDVRAALLRLAVANARQERELVQQRLQAAAPRLGCLSVRRCGINVQEVRPLPACMALQLLREGVASDRRHAQHVAQQSCRGVSQGATHAALQSFVALVSPKALVTSKADVTGFRRCFHQVGVQPPACGSPQVWEDGQAFKDAQLRLRAAAEQRESIEAARKAAKRRLPLPGQALPAERGSGEAAGSVLHPDDWVVQVGGGCGGMPNLLARPGQRPGQQAAARRF